MKPKCPFSCKIRTVPAIEVVGRVLFKLGDDEQQDGEESKSNRAAAEMNGFKLGSR